MNNFPMTKEAEQRFETHVKVWGEAVEAIAIWIASCQSTLLVTEDMVIEAVRLMKIIEDKRRKIS